MDYTYIKIPTASWDILAETLSMDIESGSFSSDLRLEIEEAFSEVEIVNMDGTELGDTISEDFPIPLEAGGTIRLSKAADAVINSMTNVGEKSDQDLMYEGEEPVLPITFWRFDDDMDQDSVEALILAYNNVGPGIGTLEWNDDPDGEMDQFIIFWKGFTHKFVISENMGVETHEKRQFLLDENQDKCIYCQSDDVGFDEVDNEDPHSDIYICGECRRSWTKNYAFVGVNNYFPKPKLGGDDE